MKGKKTAVARKRAARNGARDASLQRLATTHQATIAAPQAPNGGSVADLVRAIGREEPPATDEAKRKWQVVRSEAQARLLQPLQSPRSGERKRGLAQIALSLLSENPHNENADVRAQDAEGALEILRAPGLRNALAYIDAECAGSHLATLPESAFNSALNKAKVDAVMLRGEADAHAASHIQRIVGRFSYRSTLPHDTQTLDYPLTAQELALLAIACGYETKDTPNPSLKQSLMVATEAVRKAANKRKAAASVHEGEWLDKSFVLTRKRGRPKRVK